MAEERTATGNMVTEPSVAGDDVSPKLIRHRGLAVPGPAPAGELGEVRSLSQPVEQVVQRIADHGPVGLGGDAETGRDGQSGRDHHARG